MNKFVSVDNNKVVFTKKQQSLHTATITINNLVNKFVIYKVFINKNVIYRASPSEGFITPNGKATVSIKRTASEVTPGDKPDQFLIVAFETNLIIKTVILFLI